MAMNIQLRDIRKDITRTVQMALEEDIGSGDITALLIPEDKVSTATVITREDCILCGQAWFEEVFTQLGGITDITWHYGDGDQVKAGSTFVTLTGNARKLLIGERTALNFVQLLSGTATRTSEFVRLTEGSTVRVLDTRKTIPGLRTAQKYAVTCGRGHNHRIGLFDAFLIKENHIAACGGIAAAVAEARKIAADKPVEVEVENLEELQQALDAKADIVMLDNFSLDNLRKASTLNAYRAKLEASGNINKITLPSIASTGVNYISVGDLTKHCRAVDLSMRLK
jgi:nicotinate-nucleotide pyrophosphorylase (carboxylating)